MTPDKWERLRAAADAIAQPPSPDARLEGRRLPNGVPPQTYEPCDYGWYGGRWVARTPDGKRCELRSVVEHASRRVSAVTSSWLLIEGKWHA